MLRRGTLLTITCSDSRYFTDLTPLFVEDVSPRIKVGWLEGNDIVCVLEDVDELLAHQNRRVKVLSRLGVGWVSKMWVRKV